MHKSSLAKKLRFLFLFLTAVIKKQYRMVVLGLALGVAGFFILPKIVILIPLPQREVKVGLVGQYTVNDLPEEVLNDISLGLTTVSTKGEAISALAESWQISEDGKTYTFKLKNEDIFWHDKQKFNPGDVNYNFKDVSFSVNGSTITFNLKEPYAPFPVILSKPLFRKGLIGLGQYKVKKIDHNGKFVKNILLVPVTDNSLPRKVYRFYTTEKDLKTGFDLGEVNTIANLFDLAGLATGPKVKVAKQVMKNAFLGVFFNTAKTPFSDKAFRQALSYAIPKETDDKKRAIGPINPFSWAYNPDVKPYKLDLANAKKLLESEKEGLKNLNIKIQTFPQYESTANLVRDSWKELGISSEVQITNYVPEDFDVLVLAREIPQDPDQYYFWHSTQAGNLANFKSPRIDKLLEDGRKIADKTERENIYFDFQRFLVEDSPIVFLNHPEVYTVTRE